MKLGGRPEASSRRTSWRCFSEEGALPGLCQNTWPLQVRMGAGSGPRCELWLCSELRGSGHVAGAVCTPLSPLHNEEVICRLLGM